MNKKEKVYQKVINFFQAQDVTCEEAIHQCDRVIENAYDLLADLYNIVEDELKFEED
jgi:hypothetical protein